MNILLLTIPVSIALAVFFVVCFFRAVKGGQFQDLETPAHAILSDEKVQIEKTMNKNAEESLHG